MTVLVTSMDGKPLREVWVKAAGPIDREGSTDTSGTVVFTNVNAGTYRLRFEHGDFVTFEREVTVVGGRPLRTTSALNAAPPPPAAPKVEPSAPAPPPVAPTPSGNYVPNWVPILDFIENNYVGRAPSKRSPMGCTASATSTLIQIRDPLSEHTHPDADEVLYVVAGSGTGKVAGRESPLETTGLLVIPRGVPHSVTRRGSNPITVLSVLSGPPCDQAKQ
jgi:mannose-6-phosphate isomerase-like protein (cupin superfamily)